MREPEQENIITVSHLNKEFVKDGTSFQVLKDVDLSVKKGEFVTIVGHSGCGKSTLLKIICGLVSYQDGSVSRNGHAVSGPDAECGMVFQDHRLLPWLKIRDNIGFGIRNMTKAEREEHIARHLELVGLKGYLLSAVLGMVLGSLMGMSKTVAHLLQPTVTVIRQIPIIAWIPLIILWCGIGELSKVVVIVMAAFFPIMMNTMSGISSTPAGYIEVAQLYKLNFFKTFRKVYLPHALPQILVGLKLGLGISWMAVVAAELIASLSGIGYRMSNARSLMQSDVVIVCMIVIGVVGILMDKILGVIFTAITPWNKKQK